MVEAIQHREKLLQQRRQVWSVSGGETSGGGTAGEIAGGMSRVARALTCFGPRHWKSLKDS